MNLFKYMKYTLDAKEKKLGRIASEAAALLMGKNKTDFSRNAVENVEVCIVNASKIKLISDKVTKKEYANYTGYPGGFVMQKMKDIVGKKGFAEIMRRAVYGMLPSNKLRAKILKNLTITE